MGPKELIKTSQQIGRWVGKFRTQVNNFKILLNEELLQEEKEKLKEIKELADVKNTDSEKNIKNNEGGTPGGTTSN
jgi:Sec-independent protein translocase protein TatA